MHSYAAPAFATAKPNRTRSLTGSPFDESGEPYLTGEPTEEEWEAHDQWLADFL